MVAKQNNSPANHPYERLVAMYGYPGPEDIDPTVFLTVVYTVLFGAMLADVGQGLCLTVIGLFWQKKAPEGMGGLMLRCGLSAACWGLVFGTVFGSERWLTGIYARLGLRPLTVMENVTGILAASVALGGGLLTFSMGLHLVQCLRLHKWQEALLGENGAAGVLTYWGLMLLIVPAILGRMLLPPVFPAAMLIIGAVLLLVREWLSKESKHGGLFVGLFTLLTDVLGYFSNTLSFLRVGAFVLVHAGMMLVVYALAPATGIGRLLVLAVGNAAVLAVESVLAYIQTLRLVYYELFSRFYAGDGQRVIEKTGER